MQLSTHLVALTLASSVALLVGCNSTPVSGTTPRIITGSITALATDRSSMTVGGQTIALSRLASGGAVKINGARVNLRALSVGQKVRVSAQGNEASEVDVELELKGAISSIDLTAKTVTVAGTIVVVSATTRIDLSSDDDSATSTTRTINDLSLGAIVEITGARDASGQVLATKIEVKSASELTDDGENNDQGIHGAVSGLDLVAGSFKIGKLTVTCTGACKLPSGLKNGDVVEVSGTLDATGATLSASSVRLEGSNDQPAAPGATVALEDHARALDAGAKTFRLEGFVVDYSAASVTGTLVERAEVSVTGTVDAADVTLVHAATVAVRVENR